MPLWVLSLAYALHMLATVIWIGGILYQSLFLLPVISASEEDTANLILLERLRTRFQPAAWLSLAVLVGTGLPQMTTNPNYGGLLAIENTWAQAILLKHIAIAGMIVMAAYQSFILYPKLTRTLIMRTRQGDSRPPIESPGKERLLANLNVLLAIIVLFLTSIARAA